MTKTTRASRTDGEQTRIRILETAGLMFADHGYADTPSKAIAEQAGVDLASINYHFGSRAGLYQAVLTHAHDSAIQLESLQELANGSLPPMDKVKRLIDLLIDIALNEQNWYARVLAREVLAPSSQLVTLIETVGMPKFALALRILSEATGIPVGNPALQRCMFSIITPCLILLAAGRGLPGLAQEVRGMPPEDIRAHMYSFAVGGLAAISAQFPPLGPGDKR